MGQSSTIITKGFNVLEIQDLVLFQISYLLCGWGIITNSMTGFSVSSCLSSLPSS
jgi:hypothetical protein